MNKLFPNTAYIAYAPEGGAAGGAGTGTTTTTAPPAGGAPPSVFTPPWGADNNATWMIGDGANAKPWYEVAIPDGPTKDLFREKKYANPVVSADAYYSANRMVNGQAVEIPQADAKPEVWNDFYTKLGRPEAPEKYDVKIADGITVDDNMLKFGKQMAFDLGLPPAKAQQMVDKWNEFAMKQNGAGIAEQQQANDKEADAVKITWGDKYDANLGNGKRAVQALYDLTKPEEKALFSKIEGHIGAASMLDLFARLGSKSGEGGLVGGGSTTTDNIATMTVTQANAEINRLRADVEFGKKFNDKNHPEHKDAVERMNSLYARAQVRA